MGKMILCSGVRTKRPYVFTTSGNRIYSMDELCFYVSSNIYFIDEEMFTPSLIEWIGTELELRSRAEKLALLKEQNADIKTLLAALLCSADYYTEQEIKSILRMVDELNGMSPIKRSCIRARSYLEIQKYVEAACEYEQILNSKEAANMTPEEYGDILHNLAVVKVHSKGLKEASDIFLQAFERNRREESLRQYLYTVKLSKRTDLLEEKLEEYQVGSDLKRDILLTMDQLEEEANSCEGIMEIQELKRWRLEGRLMEYNKRVEYILDEWITTLRQI
ncbi:MAG TPA: hypothetical protein VJ888_04720 [Mobilitalea sp.]|nr:hypothetical protein [Mobilitalea sp.]